jgi:hypothetical protein
LPLITQKDFFLVLSFLPFTDNGNQGDSPSPGSHPNPLSVLHHREATLASCIGNLKINLNLEKGYRQSKSCRLSSGLSIAGWWEGKDVA